MANKKYRNGGDTPVPETKDSDFSPYDLNKDGVVSKSEMQRANAKSKSKSLKAVYPGRGTGPYSGT
jgi:Ca2+-binding EF-hand superfamily protein